MQVNHSSINPLQQSNISSDKTITGTQGELTTNINTASTVQISEDAKINQQIDDLFNQVDEIFMSHLTPQQKAELKQSYKKLDEIFAHSGANAPISKAEEKIFDRIDNIFIEAEKSLSKEDLDKLNKLDDSINQLFGQEQLPDDKFFEQLDALENDQTSLLMTSLSKKQKDEIDSLNKTLEAIFKQQNMSKEDEEKVDKLFAGINSILNQGYNNLSQQNKDKVDALNESVETLYQGLS